ncbi:MAG TPA: hypothetical protein VF610_04510, partial [Segetibacter sp.]
MNSIKKLGFSLACVLITASSFCQNDAAMQKAFSESYTHEYNKRYSDAIAVLSKFNSERSYEVHLRLGWLYYLNKNYGQSQAFYGKAAAEKPYAVEAKLGLVKPLSVLENWD